MSDATSTNDSSWLAAAVGGALAGLVGAALGVVMAAIYWDAGFWRLVLGGAIVGGFPAMLTAAGLAFHGAAVGESQEGADAPQWGVLAGLVCGLAVNPLMGLFIGWSLGAPGLGGAIGVLLGAVAGVLGWQTGYWLAHMGAR